MNFKARFLTVSNDKECSKVLCVVFAFKKTNKKQLVLSSLFSTRCLCRSVLSVAREVERVIH